MSIVIILLLFLLFIFAAHKGLYIAAKYRKKEAAIANGILFGVISSCTFLFLIFLKIFQYPLGAFSLLFVSPLYIAFIAPISFLLGWSATNLKFYSQDAARRNNAKKIISIFLLISIVAGILTYGYSGFLMIRAKSADTRAEELVKIYENNIVKPRYVLLSVLAKNPATPPDVLRQLSGAGSDNKNEDWLLLSLWFDGSDLRTTRQRLCENPSTPVDVLLELMQSVSGCMVGRNPSTPANILRNISTNRSEFVRRDVASHSNSPADILITLARDPSSYVRYGVVQNPNTPVKALFILSEDIDPTIRQHVPVHPRVSLEILKKLARDPDNGVRGAAILALKTRGLEL